MAHSESAFSRSSACLLPWALVGLWIATHLSPTWPTPHPEQTLPGMGARGADTAHPWEGLGACSAHPLLPASPLPPLRTPISFLMEVGHLSWTLSGHRSMA